MSVIPATAPSQVFFLKRYKATRTLGQGGMGQVYLGQDLESGKEVVIKVMHDHLAQVPSIRQSFQRELQLMMRFRHPNSVQLIDGSLEGPGKPCLVMEYIDGIDLEHHIGGAGRFTAEEIAPWVIQLCQVLHAAHASNILHGDLSLNNLMLANAGTKNESLKVMDFGLARLTTAYFIPLDKLNGSGSGIGGGTPDYVAPEQVRGEQVDARSDLYSVGVGLYKLLTGYLPFQEYTEINDILRAHVSQTPPSFADRGVRDVTREIEEVVRQLLSKHPAERPDSAKELAIRFERAFHRRIIPDGAFNVVPLQKQEEALPYDPEQCLDLMEAFMPQQIAIMKLRGFVESVGGLIESSEPGKIRIQVVDPRTQPAKPAKPSLFGFLKRETLPPKHYLGLDLHMRKKEAGNRSVVEIAVVLAKNAGDSRNECNMRAGFAQRVCRELRAYLMT